MGHNQSKPRNKRSTLPTAPTQRLYPNLAEEFSTYGRSHTVDFHAPPPYSQEACFGNTIATLNGQRYTEYSIPPSAPPESQKNGQSLEKQEDGSAPIKNENNCKNEDISSGKQPCPNAKDGCILHFESEEMRQHVKECLFMDILCPLNGVIGKCAWQDKMKNILTHFYDNHRENIGQVNKKCTLTGLRTIQLVDIAPYKFLVHIKVDEAKKKILVAVQHYKVYKTPFCASKWRYEFVFEVNGATLTKLNDTCIPVGTCVEEKFDKLQCRVLDMDSKVMHAFKNGELKYNYRIMQKGNGRSNLKCTKLEADENTTNVETLSARSVDLKKNRKMKTSKKAALKKGANCVAASSAVRSAPRP